MDFSGFYDALTKAVYRSTTVPFSAFNKTDAKQILQKNFESILDMHEQKVTILKALKRLEDLPTH